MKVISSMLVRKERWCRGVLELYEQSGLTMPTNEGREQKLRRLDRLVIDRLIEAAQDRGIFYQTVRCPFEEGEPVYAGGMIKEQSHIQIAVRDRACISGRIFLVGSKEISNE